MPQCIVYKNTKTIIQKIESLSQYRKNGANHNIADCNLTNKKLKEIRQKKKGKKKSGRTPVACNTEDVQELCH